MRTLMESETFVALVYYPGIHILKGSRFLNCSEKSRGDKLMVSSDVSCFPGHMPTAPMALGLGLMVNLT